MHIPDNFLSTPVWATLDAIAVPAVAMVSRKAQQATDTNRLPLLGVMGAFVFAAQMINFPVGIGTSGHLVGGTLLACILGPWAGGLVITSILLIQALVFQDGGILALGANIINMGLLGVLAGYLPAKLLSRGKWKAHGLFIGGFCSVMMSGLLALTELTLSDVRMPPALLEASLGLFAVNAVIEGAITASVVRAIERLRSGGPSLTIETSTDSRTPRDMWKNVLTAMAMAAVLLASVGVLIASALPDGLAYLAKTLGMPFGAQPLLHAPLRDYHIQALGESWLSRASAGLVGLILIYIVCALGGYLLGRGRRSYS
jgi:cobalt/nickel transport system permease protein